jgi:hypothetical protein
MQEVRGSNLGAGEYFRGRKSLADENPRKSLADSENGWMDARARSRARARVADSQIVYSGVIAKKDRFFFTLTT